MFHRETIARYYDVLCMALKVGKPHCNKTHTTETQQLQKDHDEFLYEPCSSCARFQHMKLFAEFVNEVSHSHLLLF